MKSKGKYKEDIERKSRKSTTIKGMLGIIGAIAGNTAIGRSLKKMPINTNKAQMMNDVSDFIKKHNTNISLETTLNPSNSVRFDNKTPAKITDSTKQKLKSRFGDSIIDSLNKAYKDKSSLIVSYPNEAIFYHELGHAKDFKPGSRKRLIIYAPSASNLITTPLISKNVRKNVRKIGNGKNGIANKTIDFIEKYPEVAFYAPAMIGLTNELSASAYATKHLVNKYGVGNGLKKATPLALGLASHATAKMPMAILKGQYVRRTKTKED